VKRSKSLRNSVFLAGLLLLITSRKVHAYIDPGSGSYVLQLIIAGLLGAGVALKIYWKRIIAFISGPFSRGQGEEDGSK
jgi:hypothetical protein